MSERVFKILSIDGGGIRGLYSAAILAKIEDVYGSIHDYFDMICGTSTGGIIALALALGLPAQDVVEFYHKWGPKIFPYKHRLLRSMKWALFASKYSDTMLRTALESIFGQSVLNDAKCCLCIPAVNMVNGAGVIFKTSHDSQYVRDGRLRMVDVALATSAAPTYFPIASIDKVSSLIVDGGLFANNPSLIGAVEAINHFVGRGYDKFSVLSISNISTNPPWALSKSRRASVISWCRNIVPLMLNVQSRAVANILEIILVNKLFPMDNYVRIPDPPLSSQQLKVLDLDRADRLALETLRDLAHSQADYCINRPEVRAFFDKSTPRKKFNFEEVVVDGGL